MNEEKVTITLPLANAVLQYLGTRPYQDVFMLIGQLQAEIGPQIKQTNAVTQPTN